jgi:hypothetical protein
VDLGDLGTGHARAGPTLWEGREVNKKREKLPRQGIFCTDNPYSILFRYERVRQIVVNASPHRGYMQVKEKDEEKT